MPAAGEADLHRNGDASDHQIVWYTAIGMALRDAVREDSGKCYPHVGGIVICKRRQTYRIDARFLAKRPALDDGNDYGAYSRATGH
jgi:hypothetical protein